MDGLQYLLTRVLTPLMSPIIPSERIYWLYLGSALIIAFVVYFATYASRRAGLLTGFITYCFPKNVFAHKSAIVYYKYFLINKITFAILFAPLIIGSSVVWMERRRPRVHVGSGRTRWSSRSPDQRRPYHLRDPGVGRRDFHRPLSAT